MGTVHSIADFSEHSDFVRIIGVNDSYHDDICALDKACGRNTIFYQRLNGLPKISVDESKFYGKTYDDYRKSGRKTLTTKIPSQKTMSFFLKAVTELDRLIRSRIRNISDSMIKNITVQSLYRLDCIFNDTDIERKISLPKKIVIADVTRRNDYFFACMLANIGCGVMLLQYQADISKELDSYGLSAAISIGSFRPTPPLPPLTNRTTVGSMPPTDTRLSSSTSSITHPEQNKTPPTVIIPKHPNRHSQNSPVIQAGSAYNNVDHNETNRFRRPPVSTSCQPYRSAPPRPINSERREKSYEELAQLASSVVLIMINDRRGNVVGSGSGVMIGRDGFILTNQHVVKTGAYFSVRIENDQCVYETNEIIKYNTVTDMAIIRIDKQLTPLSLYRGHKKLVRGQKVIAIGSPLGLFNSVSDGIISGMRKVDDIEMIQFTAPISHGSSGGAVLNMYGELIGLSTAGLDEGQNLNLAVGYEYILPFTQGFDY